MDVWNNEIKPFMNNKFQSQFMDIFFLVNLIDGTLKGKKTIKRKDSKITKMKISFSEINKEEIEQKRTNSMTSIRPHSQTIDSKKTRESSMGRKNSDLNNNQSSAKNLTIMKEIYLNKTVDIEKNKLKLDEDNKVQVQRHTEYKKFKTNIDESIIQKNELTFEEFLNKIIHDNYISYNAALIYHFCQQCFCFITVEQLFEQINICYENIQKNNSEDELNKLIEFVNVLVIEMICYYKGDETKDNNISIVENFYYKLISDLIVNLINKDKDKIEEKNIIQPFKLDDSENNIINEKTEIIIEQKDDYLKIKDDLIKMNLDATPEYKENDIKKKIELKIRKSSFKRLNNTFINKKVNFEEEKEEENIMDKISFDNKDTKKFLRATMTLRNPKHFSLSKNKLKDVIKEEDEGKEGSGEDKRNKSFESRKSIISNNNSSSDNERDNKNKARRKNTKELLEKMQKKINEILDKIIQKVNIPPENIITLKEEQLCILKKIITIIESDEKEGEEIQEKNLNDVKDNINIYKEVRKIQNKKNKEIITQRKKQKRMTKNFSSLISFTLKKNNIEEILNKGYFCVTDWKPEDIGNQLMTISKTLLNKIYPRELYKAIFLKKEKEKTSPNVVECINKFNRLTSFVMEDILSYNKPKDRAKIYEKWVLIADYCKENKDYNDLIAIFSAFNHYIITGLKLTLKEVKTKSNSILNKIRNFCAVEGNYKNIREDMNNCYNKGEFFIPYLGMLLRDLNFFEEKYKYINKDGKINFEKIEKISGIFELYFKFKNKKDSNNNSNKIPELEFFNYLEDITEEKLDEISSNLEPEFKFEEESLKKRLTNIDKKYFFKNNDKEEDEGEPVDLDQAFYV